MKLESRLFSIARSFFAVCFLCFVFAPMASIAGVPESNPTATALPPTCDPEFWDVLKNRAWEGGQREITQNNNLIARPDSVLSLSCFDSSLNHLAWYADRYFPGNPDVSKGGFGGVFTDLFIILPDSIASGINKSATDGFLMYSALELLVLDQLASATDAITRAGDIAGILPCTGKEYYINSNFPSDMLGGRAIGLSGHMPSSVSRSSHNGCPRMNQVWNRAKCYNFLSEASHDGFYSLKTYSTSGDYRTKDRACSSPKPDGSPDLPSGSELLCDARVHSTPISWGFSLPAVFAGNTPPTWGSAFAGANPVSGAAGGIDTYTHFLGLRDSINCSSLTPVKTGFIASKGAVQYPDAVCPAPGCYYNPPPSMSGNGSCN